MFVYIFDYLFGVIGVLGNSLVSNIIHKFDKPPFEDLKPFQY